MQRCRLTCVGSTAMALVLIAGGCGEQSPTEPFPDRIGLVCVDSIGIEVGDSNYVFGAIGDVCFGPNGEILVLDPVSSCVRAYTTECEFIRRIGRLGNGPGELINPLTVASLENGIVFVMDPMKNAYVLFDGFDDYSFIEELSLWGNNPPTEATGLDGNAFVGIRFEVEPAEGSLVGSMTLGRFIMGVELPEVSYRVDEFPFDLSDVPGLLKRMLFSAVVTGDSEGRVFYAVMSTEIYEVIAADRSGEELFRIAQDVPRAAKSDLEMEEEAEYLESWVERMSSGNTLGLAWEAEPYRWMITGLGVDCAGRLWVQRGTELEPVFDIYDLSGQHLFSAQLPMESRSWKFHVAAEGMLAWEEDPETGFQKLYVIEPLE